MGCSVSVPIVGRMRARAEGHASFKLDIERAVALGMPCALHEQNFQEFSKRPVAHAQHDPVDDVGYACLLHNSSGVKWSFRDFVELGRVAPGKQRNCRVNFNFLRRGTLCDCCDMASQRDGDIRHNFSKCKPMSHAVSRAICKASCCLWSFALWHDLLDAHPGDEDAG